MAAQLTAHRYKVKGDRIQIEEKDEVKERVGSSPDEADAVVIAWHRRRAAVKRPVAPKGPRAEPRGNTGWLAI